MFAVIILIRPRVPPKAVGALGHASRASGFFVLMSREMPSFLQVEQLGANSGLLGVVASLYTEVFAQPPWNEISKCPQCKQFSALEPGQSCPCGNGTLSVAYPKEETVAHIAEELSNPQARGLLGRDKETGDPIAFGWAYALNGLTFSETKYEKLDSRPIIAGVVGNREYCYVSEVGVSFQFQGKKLGTIITSLLGDRTLLPLLMRTREDSPMMYIAKKLGMRPILGPANGIFDPENRTRVIFIRDAL